MGSDLFQTDSVKGHGIGSKAAIPVLQFDNWDIKPLHAVKVDGKAMPKVNGCLLQGQTRKRRAESDAQSELHRKKVRCTANDTWKPVVVLENRGIFINKFDSVAHERLISQFNDVVSGLASFYRQALLGGSSLYLMNYIVGIRSGLQHEVREKPINFRTLLLSAFKPHGGQSMSGDFDQHAVYVEICRDSAADVLTARRFVWLIEGQLKPGRVKSPG